MSRTSEKVFEIIVIGDRCKECGLCINICPVKILSTSDKINRKGFYITVPIYPEKCIGCRLCEYICPDYAICVRPARDSRSSGKIVWSRVELYES